MERRHLTFLNALIAVFFLISCTDSSSPQAPLSGPQLPSEKMKIVKSSPLTRSEKTQIKDIFEKIEFTNFIDRLAPTSQETEDQKSRRLESIANLKPELTAILSPIQKKCLALPQIIDRSEDLDPSQDGKSWMKSQISIAQNISGSPDICPISFFRTQQDQQEVLESNRAELEAEFEKNHDPSTFERLEETYIQLFETKASLQLKEKEIRTSQEFESFTDESKINLEKRQLGKGSSFRQETLQNMDRLINIQLLDTTEVSLSLTSESVQNSTGTDYARLIEISIADKTTTIQVVKSLKKDLAECYLNGELKSFEQIRQELGMDLDQLANISQNNQ